MSRTAYPWKRGATLAIRARAISGEPDGTEVVRCVGKLVEHASDAPPGDDAPEAFEFASAFTAAAGEDPAYWTFTVAASVSETLALGAYLGDIRIEKDGAVQYTETFAFQIGERVTEES